MACLPCERARLARLGKISNNMAKKKSSKKKGGARKRKRVGGLGGKITNRSITVQLQDLLYLAGGAVLNYAVVNPLINKLTDKLKKSDGTPMLGDYQTKILTALKGGGAAWAAYATKLPKEVKLALFGVAGASGVELAGQIMPDKMKSLNGTGDMWLSGTGDMYIGSTQLLEIPMRAGTVNDVPEDVVPVFGSGDEYFTSDLVTM
jgi:hypothetical protein